MLLSPVFFLCFDFYCILLYFFLLSAFLACKEDLNNFFLLFRIHISSNIDDMYSLPLKEKTWKWRLYWKTRENLSCETKSIILNKNVRRWAKLTHRIKWLREIDSPKKIDLTELRWNYRWAHKQNNTSHNREKLSLCQKRRKLFSLDFTSYCKLNSFVFRIDKRNCSFCESGDGETLYYYVFGSRLMKGTALRCKWNHKSFWFCYFQY